MCFSAVRPEKVTSCLLCSFTCGLSAVALSESVACSMSIGTWDTFARECAARWGQKMRACVYAHAYTERMIGTNIHIHACIYIYMYMHIYICTYIYTYVHTYIYICAHTNTCTYRYIYPLCMYNDKNMWIYMTGTCTRNTSTHSVFILECGLMFILGS